MLILALEASAKTASAAISKDGALLGQYFQNCGLTHSVTLLPMAEALLKNTNLTTADVDRFAVSHGPGSFTGVRIGVSTVKGLAWAAEKPCVGVSTLEAMAWSGLCAAPGSLICCAMDARRAQVYNALFRIEAGRPLRLTEDRAVGLDELTDELNSTGKPILVLGDGALLCYNHFSERNVPVSLAPENIRLQNAWGVCRAAEGKEPIGAAELLPRYLRLSQAERERLERLKKETK